MCKQDCTPCHGIQICYVAQNDGLPTQDRAQIVCCCVVCLQMANLAFMYVVRRKADKQNR